MGRRSGREYVGGGKSLVRDKRNITHRTFDKETATSNSKVTMPAVTGDKSNKYITLFDVGIHRKPLRWTNTKQSDYGYNTAAVNVVARSVFCV